MEKPIVKKRHVECFERMGQLTIEYLAMDENGDIKEILETPDLTLDEGAGPLGKYQSFLKRKLAEFEQQGIGKIVLVNGSSTVNHFPRYPFKKECFETMIKPIEDAYNCRMGKVETSENIISVKPLGNSAIDDYLMSIYKK